MVQIRPVSDLRNKFTDIERIVQTGDPVYLTKNGYGTMVVLSIDAYSRLTEPEEYIMDVADSAAASTDKRLSRDEVFGSLRRKINAEK
ncbi:MAG: type II toxin-antitoxin system Phd/YefM family antitoxin [Lachnospiraceae bacterium]|nr:type II toxin-antitoxin system Phd/YefM family antitoxin [Lachnospiraceae bacterium]